MNFKRTRFNNTNINLLYDDTDFQNVIKKATDNLIKNPWLMKYPLDLQLFAENENENENENEDESEVVRTIKEEYEGKLEKQKNDYEQKIKSMQENYTKTIKVIMSGRGQIEETTEIKEKSFEEELLNDTRKNLGLKGGND